MLFSPLTQTHTLIGNRASPGVALRAFDSIFDYAKEDPDVRTDVRISILEMYNEHIRDLLDNDSEAFLDREGNINNNFSSPLMSGAYARTGGTADDVRDWDASGAGEVAGILRDSHKSYEVRLGKTGVYVEGLTEWPVEGAEQMKQMLDNASEARRARNGGVDQSSRSHLVIIVKVL